MNEKKEKPLNSSSSDIFEMLKNIKDITSNNELIGYFQFTKFYGLLDPVNKQRLQQIEEQNKKLLRSTTAGLISTFVFSYYFQKRNFYTISLFGAVLGISPIIYIYWSSTNEINFQLLEMKHNYILKVDKFFEEEKNPSILNPNFLAEDLIDPDLRCYQILLKNKAMRKI